MKSVMITGGAGNLGSKLCAAFAAAEWCGRVVALDRAEALRARPASSLPKLEPIALDLSDPAMERSGSADLAGALAGIDAIVHFAVLNPMPDATWAESSGSVAMTARLLLAARDAGVRRFVFASSNHTVGALKDGPPIPPGLLTVDAVAPGTRMETERGVVVGTAYGASKALTEQVCVAAAVPGGLSTVSVRIGWCQSGENTPHTLSAGGNPNAPLGGPATETGARDLRWFRSMWLSNRDFVALFERAVLAEADAWPAPGIVVNGMSANAGMPWDIETTRRLLGYAPRDDVWTALGSP